MGGPLDDCSDALAAGSDGLVIFDQHYTLWDLLRLKNFEIVGTCPWNRSKEVHYQSLDHKVMTKSLDGFEKAWAETNTVSDIILLLTV